MAGIIEGPFVWPTWIYGGTNLWSHLRFSSRAPQPRCANNSEILAWAKLRFFQVVGRVDNGDHGTRELRISKRWLKGQVMECQLDGDNRERWVQILALTLSLTVTLGKLPHISRLQFLPTYKWGCWLIWLTSLPFLQFCGSGCKTASTIWPWETLPIPSGHWGQTTFTTPEKQIPFMLPDRWCNSFIFSWKHEKCSGPFS